MSEINVKTKYVECQCHRFEDTIRVTKYYDSYEPEEFCYLETFIVPETSFFKRVWYALKYVFLGQRKSSAETVLTKKDIESMLELFDSQNDQKVEENKLLLD